MIHQRFFPTAAQAPLGTLEVTLVLKTPRRQIPCRITRTIFGLLYTATAQVKTQNGLLLQEGAYVCVRDPDQAPHAFEEMLAKADKPGKFWTWGNVGLIVFHKAYGYALEK